MYIHRYFFLPTFLSQMWYQMYDLDNLDGSSGEVLEAVELVTNMYNTTIRYVTKFTWHKMMPPWPSKQQVDMVFIKNVLRNHFD